MDEDDGQASKKIVNIWSKDRLRPNQIFDVKHGKDIKELIQFEKDLINKSHSVNQFLPAQQLIDVKQYFESTLKPVQSNKVRLPPLKNIALFFDSDAKSSPNKNRMTIEDFS